MNTIYCFNNGGPARFLHAVAIADDGNVLAEHCCSSEAFMPHDLGMCSKWKHENYDAHFGAGNWKLEWVNNVKNHPGVQAALLKMKRYHEHTNP